MKKDVLLGTAIGDIAGSRFEINNCKTWKNFVLLHDDYCKFTDDTVMTFAVAKALISCKSDFTKLSFKFFPSICEDNVRIAPATSLDFAACMVIDSL